LSERQKVRSFCRWLFRNNPFDAHPRLEGSLSPLRLETLNSVALFEKELIEFVERRLLLSRSSSFALLLQGLLLLGLEE
jgi:hypothetical protein